MVRGWGSGWGCGCGGVNEAELEDDGGEEEEAELGGEGFAFCAEDCEGEEQEEG